MRLEKIYALLIKAGALNIIIKMEPANLTTEQVTAIITAEFKEVTDTTPEAQTIKMALAQPLVFTGHIGEMDATLDQALLDHVNNLCSTAKTAETLISTSKPINLPKAEDDGNGDHSAQHSSDDAFNPDSDSL